jgi:hypothetical protein
MDTAEAGEVPPVRLFFRFALGVTLLFYARRLPGQPELCENAMVEPGFGERGA